jgi:AhpD family alkylhydroperoxidase
MSHSTHSRLSFGSTFPEGMKAMLAFSKTLKDATTVERSLREMIEARASIINGCAYCLDLHSLNLLALGESEQRVIGLATWVDSPFYSDRERAALELTDRLTLPVSSDLSDDLFAEVDEQFTPDERNELVYLIVLINAWNRLMLANHNEAGKYEPPADLYQTASTTS